MVVLLFIFIVGMCGGGGGGGGGEVHTTPRTLSLDPPIWYLPQATRRFCKKQSYIYIVQCTYILFMGMRPSINYVHA